MFVRRQKCPILTGAKILKLISARHNKLLHQRARRWIVRACTFYWYFEKEKK